MTAAIESAVYVHTVTPADLESLGGEYTSLTGEPVTSGRLKLLARIAKVHGPDALAVLTRLYRAAGHTVNLLHNALVEPPRAERAAPDPPTLQVVEPEPPAPQSAKADEISDIDAFIDTQEFVNPPCSMHKPSEWQQRRDASYYCATCHPPTVQVGIEVDPSGQRRRASA